MAALAVLHTWPLAAAPAAQSLNANADAQLNAWIVSWVAHALPSQPAHLFDANIFAPERGTLAYSEPLVVPAVLGAPVRWLGGSPVLTFNLLVVAGLMLTGLSAWLAAWRWTGSFAAGLVAGALTAFNVHLLTRLPHLQAAHSWGLPLSWYLADRLVERPSVKTAAALSAVVALTAMTSLYSLVFVCVIVLVVAATAPGVRAWIAIGSAGLAGAILAAPILIPYARASAEGGRPIEMVAALSATPSWYLHELFPGFVALALSVVGLIAAPARRRVTCALLIVIGFVLSLGPSTPVYRFLYDWALPLRGLRAAARFGYLLLIAVAMLSAYGWAWIERRITSPRARALAAAGAVALVTAEAWQGPVQAQAFPGVPRIYTLVADAPSPVLLAEVPFYLMPEIYRNGEYVFNSTRHWRPLMNGYSGYTPASYRQRAEPMWLFPAPAAFRTLHEAGATHLMVHLEHFGSAREREELVRDLDGRADLQLMAADREGHRLYRITH